MSDTINKFMTAMPHSVNQEASLKKAQEIMKEYNCHHLPVLSGGQLLGLISEKDLQLVRPGEDIEKLKVQDFMSPEPITVSTNTSIKEAISIMVDKNINSLIVSAAPEQEWGIFTSTNALAYCAKFLDD